MNINPMRLASRFIDTEIEEAMNQDGFVHLKGILSSEAVSKLSSLFHSVYTYNENNGMWNSLYDISAEDSIVVSSSILETVAEILKKLFTDHVIPVGTFMTKNPNDLGVCDLHRDFSIINENLFEYRNLWIPLVDADVSNGTLYVLPGSHKVFDYPLAMFCEWPYKHLQQDLAHHVKTVKVKAGDLVVYSDRTLHGSHINHGQNPRPVVHLGILHPKSEPMYYHLGEDGIVRMYEVPWSFYLENSFGSPHGRFPLKGEFHYSPPEITADRALEGIRG